MGASKGLTAAWRSDTFPLPTSFQFSSKSGILCSTPHAAGQTSARFPRATEGAIGGHASCLMGWSAGNADADADADPDPDPDPDADSRSRLDRLLRSRLRSPHCSSAAVQRSDAAHVQQHPYTNKVHSSRRDGFVTMRHPSLGGSLIVVTIHCPGDGKKIASARAGLAI
ncbi:hypothetical protein MBM_07808 [Drepanopeziza brunnea f. sp. 'multigermtubi' MB_m1]|uniref:Uncharacterized protein n=1 Tax=Marssonina brunnea f. sp. multigermtubi (strain MB_m1) TaxID=1072389 RepID=K1WMT5_MARBU|nr:uncharacterized protein MBM_07808 [Drepanopeziza brunnea f. sp. 'multigermtubi' MB_m1]EKD14131.1 hypothetical protein MBM_07808 [Drepanopeziza brunnea f. sp. 'multigermtubi' MB_m1]